MPIPTATQPQVQQQQPRPAFQPMPTAEIPELQELPGSEQRDNDNNRVVNGPRMSLNISGNNNTITTSGFGMHMPFIPMQLQGIARPPMAHNVLSTQYAQQQMAMMQVAAAQMSQQFRSGGGQQLNVGNNSNSNGYNRQQGHQRP